MPQKWMYFVGGVVVGAVVLKRLPVKIPGLS
jgi:hypothetical protein